MQKLLIYIIFIVDIVPNSYGTFLLIFWIL